MKLLFLLIFLHAQCCASATNWSPGHWLSQIFLGKNWHAAQAYKQQDYEQSLVDLHALMNNDPYNPEYNYNVGTVLYKQKKYKDAQQAFLRSIDQRLQDSRLTEQAYFNCGNCYYQLQAWNNAVDAYQKVLTMNKNNEQAKHNLQLALYQLKNEELKKQEENQKSNQDQKDQQEKQDKQQCDNPSQEQFSNADKDQSQKSQSDGSSDDRDQGNDGAQSQQNGSGKNKQNKQAHDDQSLNNQKNDQSKDGNNPDGDDKNNKNIKESKDSGSQQSDDNGADQEHIQDDKKNATHQGGQKSDEGNNDQSDDVLAQPDEKAENKEMGGYRKPELKNQLQEKYESKAYDDDRLNDYHASVMKTLEDLEEKIQKHVIKNKVAVQGSEKNGKKGW